MGTILREAGAYSEPKRWIVIYPAYIDSTKSLQEGRKISRPQAVSKPTCVEIQDVLMAAGFQPILEKQKMYPRDQDREPESQGRVRIQLKNDDGTPKHNEYPTRTSVFKYVAEMIPKLKTRQPGYVPPQAAGSSGAGKKNKKKK
ncbi:unnamed protein product [Auanema sp. JU1783]|nr:unnamed protein product [Auanema sp. JU1783]